MAMLQLMSVKTTTAFVPMTTTTTTTSALSRNKLGKQQHSTNHQKVIEELNNYKTSSLHVSLYTSSDDTTTPSLVEEELTKVQKETLLRVTTPAILSSLASFFLFPQISLLLAQMMNDPGVYAVLSQDSSQFIQNYLTITGLLFGILVGQTYYFMYQQQESVFLALFQEVTEAKSLLEQISLVCQGRGKVYDRCLSSMESYVQNDLKILGADPAVTLSTRPIDDPLESIMYMTSVGIPGKVYDTVKSLRQARAWRLGALQRKLPRLHLGLLWLLAVIEVSSFPVLGAGTQTIGGYGILTVEGCLFAIMTFGIVLTLGVVGELWQPAGGAYNVDSVLGVMVEGLEEELQQRMSGNSLNRADDFSYPPPPSEISL